VMDNPEAPDSQEMQDRLGRQQPHAQRCNKPVRNAQEADPASQDHPDQPVNPAAMDSPVQPEQEEGQDSQDQRDQPAPPVNQDSQEDPDSPATREPTVSAPARSQDPRERPVNPAAQDSQEVMESPVDQEDQERPDLQVNPAAPETQEVTDNLAQLAPTASPDTTPPIVLAPDALDRPALAQAMDLLELDRHRV